LIPYSREGIGANHFALLYFLTFSFHGEVALRILVLRQIPDDHDFRLQWNEIALQTGRPQVFYTCEWALAMQAAYGDSLKPLLFLGYEGDVLSAVASLATNPDGKCVTFLAATTADYCDFLSEPHLRQSFIDALLTELRKGSFESIALANLPADSETLGALRRTVNRHHLRIFARPAYLCAQVELGSGETRQQLKQSLAVKKKLRRYLRSMEREGPVTFAHLSSFDQIQSALPEFADAHVARFRATGRASSLATPARRLFLQELTKLFNGDGVVTLSQLRIHDRPVAWNFGFQFHGTWFWYQPTFDSRQEENSPGHCLLSRIVMEACDMEEMQFVDLGLGAEGYKERFGNSARETLYVTITGSPIRHIREVVRYRLAAALRRSPKVDSAVRRLLGV
jgi:CelD/BcsL family acetyltransferase involved in cellulose biosynthesis